MKKTLLLSFLIICFISFTGFEATNLPRAAGFNLWTDGALVRPTNSANIYLIEQGKCRFIPDYNVFVAHGFSSSSYIVPITPSELSQCPTGLPLDSLIAEGAIIKTFDNPDVYIVKYKNEKQFRRLVLNPQVFESYGHLKWEDILTVSQSVMDSFVISDLVKIDRQIGIYQLMPDEDVGTNRSLSLTEEYDSDSVYVINETDFSNYTNYSGGGQVKDSAVDITIDNDNDNEDEGYVILGTYRCSIYHAGAADRLGPFIGEELYIDTKNGMLEFYAGHLESSFITAEEYNETLQKYNDGVAELDIKIDKYNAKVNAYNNYLETYCAPV